MSLVGDSERYSWTSTAELAAEGLGPQQGSRDVPAHALGAPAHAALGAALVGAALVGAVGSQGQCLAGFGTQVLRTCGQLGSKQVGLGQCQAHPFSHLSLAKVSCSNSKTSLWWAVNV